MFKFCIAFLSYSLLVYCRRLFFLCPEDTAAIFQYTKTEYGHIVSAYSFCYTLSKLILGSLNDVYSPTKLLCFSVAAVGVSLVGLACTNSVSGLYLWVPLTALFQGGAWLSLVKFIKNSYANDNFPILFTIMGCTNNFSGIISPILSFTTWRDLSYFYGVFLLLFSAFMYLVFADSTVYQPTPERKSANIQVYKKLACSSTLWKIAIFLFIANEVRALFEMWSPVYLTQFEDGSAKLRRSTTLFEIGGAFGGLTAGLVVQYLQKYFDKDESRWQTGCICTGVLLAASNSFFTSNDDHETSSFIAGAGIYACITIFGMISADAAPSSICAAASAYVSFISNFGLIFAGSPLAVFIEKYGFIVIPTFLQIQTVIFVALILVFRNIPLRIINKQD